MGDIAANVMTGITTIFNMVTESPILAATVLGVPFVSACVGIVRRLSHG